LKALIKSTAAFGSTELALTIVAFIKNKYLAVAIGTDGFGIYSLLTSFFDFFILFAGGWLATPTMKYISEFRGKKDHSNIQESINFSFSLSFYSSIVFVILFFAFSGFFIANFLSSEIAFEYYALFAASFLGTCLSNIMQAYFQGMLMVKETVFRRILIRIFDLVSIVLLVLLFNLLGFFINILLVSIFGFFIFFWQIKKYRPRLVFPDFKNEINRKIISFACVNFFLSFFDMLSLYLQRLLITRYVNISALGLYRAAIVLNNYLGLVSRSSQFYYFSSMAEDISSIERNKRLDDYLKMVVLSSILTFIPLILFSDIIIPFLFSGNFISLSPILYVFIIAQYLLGVQLGIQAIIVGLVRLKIYAIVTLLAYFLMVAIPYFLLKKIGIISLGIAAIVASFEQIVILSIYLNKRDNVRFSNYSSFLIFTGLLLVTLSILISRFFISWRILFCSFNTILVFFLMTSEDRKKIFDLMKNFFCKKY
jgi:O-antigen/teichoic acid export membrane protein